MPTYQSLEKQRQSLIEQLADLPPMRAGTLQKQFLSRKRKDGTVARRGPYWTYTFKEKGKTRGKHLLEPQAEVYASQIESCRRFRAISEEILKVSQQMADMEAQSDDAKKNSRA